MKLFEFRKNCEYVQQIQAANEDEAWAKLDENRWETAWSPTEIEELEK